MTEEKRLKKSRVLESGVEKLHLENGHTKEELEKLQADEIKEEPTSTNGNSPQDMSMDVGSQSPFNQGKISRSPCSNVEQHEELIGGEVTIKQEPGQPPKLSRSTSHKILCRPPLLFNEYLDKTKEAKATFQFISECSYTSKYIGSTEHDSMDCDCAEEWGKTTFIHASCMWPKIRD